MKAVMKKISSIVFIAALAVLFFQAPAPAAPVSLDLGVATVADPTDFCYFIAITFEKMIEERSGGDIQVEVYANAQLGQEREMLEGMRMGSVDMAVITNAYMFSLVPAAGVFDLPFIFSNAQMARTILDGPFGQSVHAQYQGKGVKPLAWGEGGFRHMVTVKTPVRALADLKGLKVRSMENAVYVASYKALGANVVPMNWADVIPSLQQGTIDGLDIPISVVDSNGFGEVCQVVSLTGHFYSPLNLTISEAKWNSLTDEQKELVQKAAIDACNAERAYLSDREADATKVLETKGVTIVRDVNYAEFQDALKTFYASYRDQIGPEFVDGLMKAISEYK
jgi:tripartite ATP-independent transporter DctP family solute receptor